MTQQSLGKDKKTAKQAYIVLALLMVYIFWGGTYLGIRIAIETMPPFIMAGVRFITAGLILYTLARLKGVPRPTLAHWKSTGIVGALMLLGGNGTVVWAEKVVPSGIAALLIATVPLWMTVLSSLGKNARKPNGGTIFGIFLGFVGIAVLVLKSGGVAGTQEINLLGMVALIFGSLSWSIGSLYSRSGNMPDSALLSTSMQMLTGGACLMVASLITGEWPKVDISAITLESYLAFGYLIVFGSIVAFNAYIWLLKNAEPTWVSTYAFVNPVVAVFLGWAFAGEVLTANSVLAAVIILTAVVIITIFRDRASSSKKVQGLSSR